MCKETNIEQKSAVGSHTEQIGIQKNYYGMLPEQAVQIAINLFMENFPKLQEEANRVARERAEELCKGIIENLIKKEFTNFSVFKDPDIQYVLYEGQKEYARLGTKDFYELLVHILSERIYNNDNNDELKIIFDEAVHIAKFVKKSHLNYLSTILFCKHLKKMPEVQTLEDLKSYCESFAKQYPLPSDITHTVPLLVMHKLLNLNLGSAEDTFSETYNFNRNDVKNILPATFDAIPADYGLSPMGMVLAGLNIQLTEHNEVHVYDWLKLFQCSTIEE